MSRADPTLDTHGLCSFISMQSPWNNPHKIYIYLLDSANPTLDKDISWLVGSIHQNCKRSAIVKSSLHQLVWQVIRTFCFVSYKPIEHYGSPGFRFSHDL
jgi:hypothetical protein